MVSKSVSLAGLVASLTLLSSGALADHLYQVKRRTIGCAAPGVADVLSDPRRSSPDRTRYLLAQGGCVTITPASRWAVVRFGTEMLLRNVVPGDGREFYVTAADVAELFPKAESPPQAAKPLSPPGQEKFVIGGVGQGNRTLTVQKAANGAMKFDLDDWTSAGNNFHVSGVAAHVASGWQYRDALNSSKADERCAVNIDPRPDGGYNVSTIDGARCEAYAGHNAILYGIDSFPASSRVKH